MNRKTLRLSLAVIAIAALALPVFAKDGALSLVPTNAITVGMVKLSDMRTSPLSSVLFQQTDKFSADGDAAKFLAEAGLSPTRDVDTLIVATAPRTTLGTEADVLVIAEGRFQPDRLVKALVERGAVRKEGYLLAPNDGDDDGPGAIAFPSASMAIIGSEKAVIAALGARSNGGTGFPTAGALGADFGRIDANATAWALVDVTRAQRITGAPTAPGRNEALGTAIKSLSTVALWAIDGGDQLKLGAFGLSNDAETLELLEDTIRGAFSALRLAVKDKAPELVPVLRRFDVSRSNGAIHVSGSIPAQTLRDIASKKRVVAAK